MGRGGEFRHRCRELLRRPEIPESRSPNILLCHELSKMCATRHTKFQGYPPNVAASCCKNECRVASPTPPPRDDVETVVKHDSGIRSVWHHPALSNPINTRRWAGFCIRKMKKKNARVEQQTMQDFGKAETLHKM